VAAAALGVSVPLGAALAAVLIVAAMTAIGRVRRQGPQVAAGILLTGGFALGMLLQSLVPGIPIRVESFLVGSILTVGDGDILLAGIVAFAALAAVVVFGKELAFSTFDPAGYRAAGYREWPVELLVLALIAASVVTSLPAVGAILAIALIAAPAAAARLVAPSFRAMLVVAPLVGAASGVLGVLASRTFAIAAGPAIALIAAGFFALALLAGRLRRVPWRGRRIPVETAEHAKATAVPTQAATFAADAGDASAGARSARPGGGGKAAPATSDRPPTSRPEEVRGT
jgi:manganese/iron transport system permease protein